MVQTTELSLGSTKGPGKMTELGTTCPNTQTEPTAAQGLLYRWPTVTLHPTDTCTAQHHYQMTELPACTTDTPINPQTYLRPTDTQNPETSMPPDTYNPYVHP